MLAQTRQMPDWAQIQSEWPDYFLHSPETKEVLLELAEGMPLRFRLRCNPCRKQGGRRVGLNSEEQQIAWLRHKAKLSGFCVLSANRTDERLTTARKPGHTIQMASVLFDGILKVSDTGLLLGTIERGVGPGKGLGFGLLSIAPVPN